MAFRVAESDHRVSAYQRAQNLRGVSALPSGKPGIGALAKVIDEQTPRAKEYKGKAAVMDTAFAAPPGLQGSIKWAVLNLPKLKDDVLRVEVWKDNQGTWGLLDGYRVRVTLAGDYDIPSAGLEGENTKDDVSGFNANRSGVGVLPLLFIPVIIIAIGALAVLGAIAWKVYKTDWGSFIAGSAVVILAVGAVGLAGLWVLSRSGAGITVGGGGRG